MNEYDISIHSSTDAREWTDFFFKTYPNCNIGWINVWLVISNAMLAMVTNLNSEKVIKLEIGKHYRTADGRIYKIIHEDDDGNCTANIRKGISQRHPVLITDVWGRNRFGQDLIEEVEL